jgi:uncharacterized protein YbcI
MAEGLNTQDLERQLADELLRVHLKTYGRGAASGHVYIHDDLVVCMLDDLELLPNEEFLVGNGHGEGVVDIRTRYQQAIETTFRAAVERIIGRRVISFASITKLDPNYVVEIFRLGEERDFPVEDPDDG